MLVLHDGQSLAVLSRLSAMHDDLAGRWYVDASFRGVLADPDETFDDRIAVERRLAQ